MKTCLVIGANGFIGSYLVDALASAGYSVKAFDRYSRPAQFNESENVTVVKGDFFDDEALKDLLNDTEYVFHTFSATTPYISDKDPYKDVQLNLLRNIQLFEMAATNDITKLVYLSSGGAAYGHIAEQKEVAEADAPMPVSPYGIGKLASEYYLEYFNRKYGLEYVAYRATNPYGPRQITKNNQGVIPAFLSKIDAGEKLTIIGDGSSSRDYIYVEDMANMIVQSFAEETQHRIYNVGSGKQTSVNEIIAMLEKLLGKTVDVEYVEEPKTFLKKSMISTARFENEFQVSATSSLEQGMAALIGSLKA